MTPKQCFSGSAFSQLPPSHAAALCQSDNKIGKVFLVGTWLLGVGPGRANTPNYLTSGYKPQKHQRRQQFHEKFSHQAASGITGKAPQILEI
jgi:hypothetical protein